MIVSYLQGGLGNTIFQIAASIGAGEFYGKEWKIQGNWKYREYFNIPDDKYVDEYALPRYTEPHFHYSLIPNVDCELFGYFQSKKYWAHCEGLIRKLFSPSEKTRKYLDKTFNGNYWDSATSIHIRGGDYRNLQEYHYNLEREYYMKAIELSGQDESDYLVFTDDLPYAKELIKGLDRVVYFESKDEIMDFFMMSRCKNHIIANSSFSWWASLLNPNTEKKVLAPPKDRWFGEKKKHYILDDLYLPEWTIVNY